MKYLWIKLFRAVNWKNSLSLMKWPKVRVRRTTHFFSSGEILAPFWRHTMIRCWWLCLQDSWPRGYETASWTLLLTIAYGNDRIPQSVISKALLFIGPHVLKLFNASFAQGIFPESWKRARLLVLEKLAHDQITSYLKKSRLLDLMQTGFRKYNNSEFFPTSLQKLADIWKVFCS